MQHQIARSLIFVSLIFVSSIKSYAQEDAYWQGLSIKNPAVIGTPSDWIFGGYVFYNLKKNTSDSWSKPKAFVAGADYKIAPKLGTIGINYSWAKSDMETLILPEIVYAYSFALKTGTLNAGISIGMHSYKSKLTSYYPDNEYGGYGGYGHYDEYYYGSQYQYDYTSELTNSNSDNFLKITHLKTGIGIFYNSNKLDLGVSTVRYIKLDDNSKSLYYFNNIDYSVVSYYTANIAYRFVFENKLVFEPNLIVDFFDEGSANFNLGIFAKYNNLIWVGYNELNWGDLHSVMLGVDFLNRFRVGYSYDFTTKFGLEKVHLHEILLGIKLN